MIAARKIVVAIELDATDAVAAVELATLLARATGATLVLLHVRNPLDTLSGLVPGSSQRDLAVEHAAAAHALEAMAAGIRQQGVTVAPVHVPAGYPADEILRIAEAEAADLLVLGTHGRTGLRRLAMGSVSALVARRARCPVLTIHEPRQADQRGAPPSSAA